MSEYMDIIGALYILKIIWICWRWTLASSPRCKRDDSRDGSCGFNSYRQHQIT